RRRPGCSTHGPSWRARFRGNGLLLLALLLSPVLEIGWRLRAFDDAHDVFLAHHEQLVTLDLDGLPGVLAEQHSVARLDVERDQLARVILLALAHGDDLALVRLLGGGVRDDDATCGPALLFDALDDHAVMQRTDFHAKLPISERGITMTCIAHKLEFADPERGLALNRVEC